MNVPALLKFAWRRLPISERWRWRLASLLVGPILPLIRGSAVREAYLRERAWQRGCIRPFEGDPLPELPPRERPDILFWGVIDWHFRIQRPQHLARGLAARGHRVFYISTVFARANRPGFQLQSLAAEDCLYLVRFHLPGAIDLYADLPDARALRQLGAGLDLLLDWTGSRGGISILQHPCWHDLAARFAGRPLVYDCLDHHAGFANTGPAIIRQESRLLRHADVVTTTSRGLFDRARRYNPRVRLVRNAADCDAFGERPATVFRDRLRRRVIGYHGAIADWMDLELLERIAERFRDCLLLLVGADECGARRRFSRHPNVLFTGEVPYRELPHYLHGMDVCLLPFRMTPLTLATNPVKVYECLAAGKPVVAVALPELRPLGDLVRVCRSHPEFIDCLGQALEEDPAVMRGARRAFARRHSWQRRVLEFQAVIDPPGRPARP